jgi:hypothetical protein
VFPAIAYDKVLRRYLVVWMSVRNAQSSSSGFDVYGIFLDRNGRPIGTEFRISDSNTVARNAAPTVAAGNGEFAVAWTVRGNACAIAVQRVATAQHVVDQLLITGARHQHSPSLAPQAVGGRYAVAFVDGDDYLPPTLFGAATSDCGDNAASTSRVRILDFAFTGAGVAPSAPRDVSPGEGTFRPQLGYSTASNQYLAVWEDRRATAGQAYRFDVYAQRLGADLGVLDGNIALAVGRDYTNDDSSATWTPRPVVAGGDDRFLALWFDRQPSDGAVVWSTLGRLVFQDGETSAPFTATRATFAQRHIGNAPSGFLAAAYTSSTREFVIGMTSYLESFSGYFSYALAQRLTEDGQLLRIDGTPQSAPGVGTTVDTQLDDKVGVAVAVRPSTSAGTAVYTLAYSKHAPNKPALDFDIWSAGLEILAPFAPPEEELYLPLVRR